MRYRFAIEEKKQAQAAMDAARAHPLQLEGQFQSRLAYTCRIGGAAETAVAAVDLSRAAASIARVGAGVAHDRVVGCIEELEAKLKPVPFQYRPVLHQCRIDVEPRRALHHVAATVAESSIVTGNKRGWVEVLLRPMRPSALANIERHSGNAIRSVSSAVLEATAAFPKLTIGRVAAARPDAERRARLPADDGADLPASHHFPHQQTLPAQGWTVVNKAADPRERKIRVGDAAAPVQIVRIVHLIAIGDVSHAGHVRRLFPGKAGLRLDSVRQVPLHRRLQLVIAGRRAAAVLQNAGEVGVRSRRQSQRAIVDVGLRWKWAERVVVVSAVTVTRNVVILHVTLVIGLAANIGHANCGHPVDLLFN